MPSGVRLRARVETPTIDITTTRLKGVPSRHQDVDLEAALAAGESRGVLRLCLRAFVIILRVWLGTLFFLPALL